MFGWEFPPFSSGGLGTACFGLTKALSDANTHITFVLPKKIDVSSKDMDIIFADSFTSSDNVKLLRIDSILSPYLSSKDYLAQKNVKDNQYYANDLISEVLRYGILGGEIAREVIFDVIHAHDWLSFRAGMAAKKVSGKPLIVHVHSTEFDRTTGNINKDIYKIEKEGMEAADGVIAVSQFTKDLIIKHYGIPAEKIQVVHNGIEKELDPRIILEGKPINRFKEMGYKIVLFVGRITVQKGPDYFIKVADLVLKYYPKAIFVVVGSGEMEHQIIEQAATLGISDKVLFAGYLRGEELKKVYKMADLFVMPSVSEPFGLTALESVVNGAPVLISNQSGVSEVLTHALKVDFWDIEEMANKILAVLLYPSLQLTLKEEAYGEIGSQSWKNAGGKLINIYRKFLDSYLLKN